MASEKPYGRTVRLFLVDGAPTGLMTAEIINWSGHTLVASRSRIADILKRPEATKTGIYFLVGEDPEMPSRTLVYIGESDNVGQRIQQHNNDASKDFWNRLCLVTSKDQNLTKSHARYLESQFIKRVKDVGKAKLANGTAPEYDFLPESDIADMTFFFDQVNIVLPVLGFDFLRDIPKPQAATLHQPAENNSTTRLDADNLLELELRDRKFGIEAHAIEFDGEYVVLKGSTARAIDEYISNSYGTHRKILLDEGKLKPTNNPDLLQFTEDVTFASPSAASAVILNRNDNGRRSWRVAKTGQTLAEWQDAQTRSVTD